MPVEQPTKPAQVAEEVAVKSDLKDDIKMKDATSAEKDVERTAKEDEGAAENAKVPVEQSVSEVKDSTAKQIPSNETGSSGAEQAANPEKKNTSDDKKSTTSDQTEKPSNSSGNVPHLHPAPSENPVAPENPSVEGPLETKPEETTKPKTNGAQPDANKSAVAQEAPSKPIEDTRKDGNGQPAVSDKSEGDKPSGDVAPEVPAAKTPPKPEGGDATTSEQLTKTPEAKAEDGKPEQKEGEKMDIESKPVEGNGTDQKPEAPKDSADTKTAALPESTTKPNVHTADKTDSGAKMQPENDVKEPEVKTKSSEAEMKDTEKRSEDDTAKGETDPLLKEAGPVENGAGVDEEKPRGKTRVQFGGVEVLPAGGAPQAEDDEDEEYKPDEMEVDDEGAADGDGEAGVGPEDIVAALPKGAIANLLNDGNLTPSELHLAAREDNAEKIRELLKEGGEMHGKVDESDMFGYTAFQLAADQGNLDALKVLMELGADKEKRTKVHSMTPLHNGKLSINHGRRTVVNGMPFILLTDIVFILQLRWKGFQRLLKCCLMQVLRRTRLQTMDEPRCT